MKAILDFIGNNWFKLALLVFLFLFLWILKNGLDVDITGWIENDNPGLPRLR